MITSRHVKLVKAEHTYSLVKGGAASQRQGLDFDPGVCLHRWQHSKLRLYGSHVVRVDYCTHGNPIPVHSWIDLPFTRLLFFILTGRVSVSVPTAARTEWFRYHSHGLPAPSPPWIHALLNSDNWFSQELNHAHRDLSLSLSLLHAYSRPCKNTSRSPGPCVLKSNQIQTRKLARYIYARNQNAWRIHCVVRKPG